MKRIMLTLLCSAAIVAAAGANTQPSADGWILSADDYEAEYTGAPVANGTLGLLPGREPFSVQHVVLNHIFDCGSDHTVSRVLRGPNPLGLTMTVDGRSADECTLTGWRQTVDMRRAEHTTEFVADGRVAVRYTYTALRNLPYAIMLTVEAEALDDVQLVFANAADIPDDYSASQSRRHAFNADGRRVDILHTDAVSRYGRVEVSASSLFIVDGNSLLAVTGDNGSSRAEATLHRGQKVSFVLAGAICTSEEFFDPGNESERLLVYIDRESPARVVARHRRLWEELWQSDIEIEGDTEAQNVVRFALYNLYSYGAAGTRKSISPMGLSAQGYNGHVFWDSELWMYPPMLLLNAGIARSMIDYRTDRLEAARRHALSYGYEGAMYPWESDSSGGEATPPWAITGPMEHHITADVGIALWNYYRVTRDLDWLKRTGWPALRSVAEFWQSRAVRNNDGSWSIEGVVGADEYAINVTDNAFTNGAAATVLRFAVKAARACGEKAPRLWSEIADGLRILRDSNGTTLEYDGYAGGMIKQADVNLLGYPLGIVSDREAMLRDLQYYEQRIDPANGPAMSFSIFCVQYARLGDAAKAEEMFRRSYRPNLRAPFGTLAETASSQNPYFATAAGGLLQAVINGFGGLEITDKGIVQRKTVLPPSWRKLTIKGVGPEHKTFIIENH